MVSYDKPLGLAGLEQLAPVQKLSHRGLVNIVKDARRTNGERACYVITCYGILQFPEGDKLAEKVQGGRHGTESPVCNGQIKAKIVRWSKNILNIAHPIKPLEWGKRLSASG